MKLLLQIICLLVVTLSQTGAIPSPPSRQPKSGATPGIASGTTAGQTGDKQLSTTVVVTNSRHAVTKNSADQPQRRKAKTDELDVSKFFIENVDDYPTDEIKRILKHTPENMKSLYNVINTPLDPNATLTERIAYKSNSFDDESGGHEEPACRTTKRNVYPRQAQRLNSLVYVPNDEEFMQVVQLEICHSANEDCNSYLRDSLPHGLTSICRQKYAYKRLMYIDEIEKRSMSDLFRYPSCCSCHIRSQPVDLRKATVNESAISSRSKEKTLDTDEIVSRAKERSTNDGSASDRNHTERRPFETNSKLGIQNHTLLTDEDKVFKSN